jgi:hypothetical protein
MSDRQAADKILRLQPQHGAPSQTVRTTDDYLREREISKHADMGR